MGLQETLKAAAVSIHAALGNLNQTVTYHALGTVTYNTATGAVSEASGANYTVQMLFDSYRSDEIDGVKILATDKKGLIPVSNLSVTPQVGRDYITDANSIKWQVVGAETDPAQAEWFLQLRKP